MCEREVSRAEMAESPCITPGAATMFSTTTRSSSRSSLFTT